MSKYRNLKELRLLSSTIELRKEGICKLASLPLLQPVLVGGPCVKLGPVQVGPCQAEGVEK